VCGCGTISFGKGETALTLSDIVTDRYWLDRFLIRPAVKEGRITGANNRSEVDWKDANGAPGEANVRFWQKSASLSRAS
jgi:hypothetical protein